MADIEKWITINGQHIPIMKGESRAKAVSNFIKSKRKTTRKTAYNKMLKEAIRPQYQDDPVAKRIAKDAANYFVKSKNPEIKDWITDEARRVNKVNKPHLDKYMKHLKKADKYREQGNMEKYHDEFRKAHIEEEKGTDKASKEWNRTPTYKMKTDKVYKKKQYSDKKSITTPTGYYSPKELHERESRLDNMYYDYWNGKMDVMDLVKKQDQLVRSGKATRGEISQSKLRASTAYDYYQKAHSKKVALKGTKTSLNTKKKKK